MCNQRVTPAESSAAQITFVLFGILGFYLLKATGIAAHRLTALISHFSSELFDRVDLKLLALARLRLIVIIIISIIHR